MSKELDKLIEQILMDILGRHLSPPLSLEKSFLDDFVPVTWENAEVFEVLVLLQGAHVRPGLELGAGSQFNLAERLLSVEH